MNHTKAQRSVSEGRKKKPTETGSSRGGFLLKTTREGETKIKGEVYSLNEERGGGPRKMC